MNIKIKNVIVTFMLAALWLMIFNCIDGGDLYANELTISRKEVKYKAYRRFEIEDGFGEHYDVYLYSENAKQQIATIENCLSWGAIWDGDLIVTGKFKLAYGKKQSETLNVYPLAELGDNVTLDLTSPYIKSFFNEDKGISDFVTIFIPEMSTNGSFYSYAMIDGKLNNVTYNYKGQKEDYVGTQVWSENEVGFKALGQNRYMSITYLNCSDHAYDMYIWKYEKSTNTMNYEEKRTGNSYK